MVYRIKRIPTCEFTYGKTLSGNSKYWLASQLNWQGLTLKDISIDSNQEVAKQTVVKPVTESLAVGIRLVQ